MKSLLCIVLILAIATTSHASDLPERQFADDQWHADINEYVEFVKTTHINMYHQVSKQEYQQAVDSLLAAVPESTDQSIAMEMVALAAMIGDGHTWTGFGDLIAPEYLPIGVYEFADGIFVTHSISGYEKYIGKQVVTIAGVPTKELLKRTSRYASRDNEWGLLSSSVHWLTNKTFLVHEKILQEDQKPTLTFTSTSGDTETVEFEFMPLKKYIEEFDKVSSTPDSELPMYRQRSSEFYWQKYLKKEKTLFAKFNVVRDIEDGPRLGVFADDLLKFVDEKKVKRLIIDVRHNGGGNGNLTRRIVRNISTNKRINQPGKLFVITGRNTFSAALMFTARMERRTEALFVGEPGAGKPNSYSEFNGFTLTNTKMHGSVSSLFHEEGEPDDTREYIPVDISVPLTSKDYFTKKDPVLQAILKY